MQIYREGIAIGPLFLHFYGLILMLGTVAGICVAISLGKKRGIDPDVYWDMAPSVIICGVIGARLWHVLMPSKSSGLTFQWYLQHPLEIFAIWKGGLGIAGTVIGGVFAVWLYCKRKGISFPAIMDTIGCRASTSSRFSSVPDFTTGTSFTSSG